MARLWFIASSNSEKALTAVTPKAAIGKVTITVIIRPALRILLPIELSSLPSLPIVDWAPTIALLNCAVSAVNLAAIVNVVDI